MKKLESKLNKLLEKIKDLGINKDESNVIAWNQFFYNTGNQNILQSTAVLVIIAESKGMTRQEIQDILGD